MTPSLRRDWTYIMVHHSATEDGATFSWPAIRRFHMTDPAHRWVDIGYHFGVERVGSDYEGIVGRPLHLQGAHCPQGEMNRRAIGVCLVGNYDIVEPDPMALDVLVGRVIAPMLMEFGIPYKNIVFHRDYNPAKSCPGRLFTKDMILARLPGGTV